LQGEDYSDKARVSRERCLLVGSVDWQMEWVRSALLTGGWRYAGNLYNWDNSLS